MDDIDGWHPRDLILQTAGIKDGASHYVKILTGFFDNLDVSDPTDPEVIIQIDVANVFNSTNRGLTLDVLNGRASRDYVCGLKKGDVIPTCDTLTNLFGYFKAMRSCEAKLRYFDWDGQVHIVKGKTGGQQGDPLEMLILNLTVHHIWGRVLAKFQGARALIFPRLLCFLRLLLSRRSSTWYMHSLRTPPNLLSLVESFPLTLFALTALWESAYLLVLIILFARLQYINSHILLDNRCVLQQQHVDVKIADAPLKKGTKQHADGWDEANKDWAHMVIHLPHAEGGFGVPFNCVTKDDAFYSTTSRFVSFLGAFSDLQDSSSWTSSPLRLLRDIHSNLISKYDCKEVCAPSQSQGNLGSSARLSSQVFLSSRRLLLYPYRNLTASLRLPSRGMRAPPPTLGLLPALPAAYSGYG
jgi:hypothetical protein